MLAQNHQITAIPEVASVMGKLGRAETALDPAPLGMIETVVVLKSYAEWPRHEFLRADGSRELRPRTLAEVRAALAAASDLPGVAPSWLQPIETRVVMLSTGIRSLLALQVLGEDGEALERFAAQAEALIAGVPGATDVQVQREGGKPYVELRLDPAKLARAGVTREAALRAAEAALGGLTGAIAVDGALRYPVRVRQDRERRDDPDEFAETRVPLPGGRGAVPLTHLLAAPEILTLATPDPAALLRALPLARQRAFTLLDRGRAELVVPAGEDPGLPAGIPVTILGRRPDPAGFTSVVGPMAIRSEGGRRTQYVMLNVIGRGEVDVVRDADTRLRTALADSRLALPPGATYRWVGRYEQKLKADAALRGIIAVSFSVMILLIYAGTRSWLITAIIIVCNAGVTTAGGFFLVWLWGAEMTTAVAIGFLVLLGVMFNDGILLGTYLQEQFRTPPRDVAEVRRRVLLAGLRRRRPAVMTNATTLLSLIPVLWSTGRGAELMQPMVLPVVGGMIFDLVSLFSVPLYFSWYWERRLARAAPVPAVTPAPAP
jgi:Cu(I)/Ag(I) efflux system membrane protein CusA/SilA